MVEKVPFVLYFRSSVTKVCYKHVIKTPALEKGAYNMLPLKKKKKYIYYLYMCVHIHKKPHTCTLHVT